MKVSFASVLGSHVHKSVLKSNLSPSACRECNFQVRLALFQQSIRNVEGWNEESVLSIVKSNSKCVGNEENYNVVKLCSTSESMVFKKPVELVTLISSLMLKVDVSLE